MRCPLPLLGLLACLALPAACVSDHRPPAGIERLWRDYVSLPGERALAIAGDPDRIWVAAAAGGHASQQAAERSALSECARRRQVRRLQAPCLLYARGDEIVWSR